MEFTLKINQEVGETLKGEISNGFKRCTFEQPKIELFPEEIRNPEKAFEAIKKNLQEINISKEVGPFCEIHHIQEHVAEPAICRPGFLQFSVKIHEISVWISSNETKKMLEEVSNSIYEKLETLDIKNLSKIGICVLDSSAFVQKNRNEQYLTMPFTCFIFPILKEDL